MPSPLKYFERGAVYFITSRAEEGLPFADESRYAPIAEAIMAKAQSLYPVEIINYDFMGNHFHMILRVFDPENVPKFIGYVKQELAHVVNRLSGRRKKTIWCEGYDSPVLLDYAAIMKYLVYVYCQPQEAHLVDKIEEYRGAHSFNRLLSGNYTSSHKEIRRTDFRGPESDYPPKEYSLTINPFGWVERFGVSKEQAYAELIERLRKREDELRVERKSNNIRLGKRFNPFTYVPKKFGRRMMCISQDIILRREYIAWMKGMRELCRAAYRRLKEGARDVFYPPGFFPPSLPRIANRVPA